MYIILYAKRTKKDIENLKAVKLDKTALKLIEVLIIMLKELAQEYPKNIKIGGLKWNF